MKSATVVPEALTTSTPRTPSASAEPARASPRPGLAPETSRPFGTLNAETARAFARLLPPPLRDCLDAVEALAISDATAEAVRALPWRRVRVSASATLEGTLALL